jgi:hypothetical protein
LFPSCLPFIGFQCIVQAHLKLMILLPQLPECLCYRHVPPPQGLPFLFYCGCLAASSLPPWSHNSTVSRPYQSETNVAIGHVPKGEVGQRPSPVSPKVSMGWPTNPYMLHDSKFPGSLLQGVDGLTRSFFLYCGSTKV